jgi:hypothetical protein
VFGNHGSQSSFATKVAVWYKKDAAVIRQFGVFLLRWSPEQLSQLSVGVETHSYHQAGRSDVYDSPKVTICAKRGALAYTYFVVSLAMRDFG